MRARASAHRQLVTEISGRGLAHPGNAEVFADGGRCLKIEIVERNNAVDPSSLREVAHCENRVLKVPLLVDVRHVKEFVNALAWPIGRAH